MDSYAIIKTLHIVSSTIVFGTGLGIAFFFWFSHRSHDPGARLFAARATVRADFLFTLPAVIVQPLSGIWLIWRSGLDWADLWLVATYALYTLAAVCWVPVVIIQMRLKAMLERQAAEMPIEQSSYDQLFKWWFRLGWPAFGGLVVVFFLMVAKPSW